MIRSIIVLFFLLTCPIVYAEIGNSTHTTLNENVILSDSIDIHNPPPDMGRWLIASGAGIVLGYIYNSNKSLQKLRQAYQKKNEEKDWKDTPYDDNVFAPLELLAG